MEREILALIKLRQCLAFQPLTTEGLANMLRTTPDGIKHVVWSLWMDGHIKAQQDARGAKRKWVIAA